MFQYLKDLWRGNLLGVARSSQWPAVRKEHLRLHPNCEVCGKGKGLFESIEVHHVQSFADHPGLELAPNNLVSLCRTDHLIFGHLKNFRSFNKDVLEDCGIWNAKIKNRPVLNKSAETKQ